MNEIEFLPDRTAITAAVSYLIDEQLAEEPVLLIVAYWGRGAEEILQVGKTFKIVCNLADGGTNPGAIESILRSRGKTVEVHSMPHLHAKVVIGSSGAVVSSSNMSDNGLDILTDSGNLEAGIHISKNESEYDRIRSWGWQCWMDSTEVTQAMLDQALASYQARPNASVAKTPTEEDISTADVPARPDYGFTESELFLPEQESNRDNKVRTASRSLKRSHAAMLDREITKREAWLTAYVANLLWTHAGQSIDWKQGTFRYPSDVVERWRDLNVADEDVYELLKWISRDKALSSSITGCARHIVAAAWERYVEVES